MAYNSKYTGAEVEALLDKVNDGGGGGYGYWNYYFFEGGSADSVVTIDGANVTVPANTIVEGNFTTDITSIPFSTNNLKRIVIRGDVSLTLGDEDNENQTVEAIDMEFSQGFARSFDDMYANFCNMTTLRVRGGKATSANYMFFGIGYYLNAGTMLDISGMDFSSCKEWEGAFAYAVSPYIDLSKIVPDPQADLSYFLTNAIVGVVDMSGWDMSNMSLNLETMGTEEVRSYLFHGLTMPTGSTANGYFVQYLMYASPQISGSFKEILRDANFTSASQICLPTIFSIIGALKQDGGGTLRLSSAAWSGLGESSIVEQLVTEKGWTLTIG